MIQRQSTLELSMTYPRRQVSPMTLSQQPSVRTERTFRLKSEKGECQLDMYRLATINMFNIG